MAKTVTVPAPAPAAPSGPKVTMLTADQAAADNPRNKRRSPLMASVPSYPTILGAAGTLG